MQFPLLRAEAIRGSSSAAVYSATTMMTIRSRSRRIPRWRSTELLFQTPTVTTTQCNSSSSSGNITTTHQRGRLLDATGTSAVVPTRRRRRRRSSRSPHSELWQQPPPPPRTQPESVAAQCLVCVGPQQLRLLPLVAGMPDVWWVQSQSHPKPRLRLPKGAAPGAAPPPPPRHAADWWYTPSFTTTTTTTTRLNNINQSHAISRMMPNRSTPLHPQQKQCRWRSTSSTTTPTESRPPSLPTEPEASLATAATTAVLQPTIPATTTGSTTKNDAMAAAAAASLAAIQQQVAALLPDLPTGSRRSSSSGTYPHPQQQLQQQQQQQPDVVWAKADFARIRRNILDPLLLIVLIRMESSSSSSPSLVATTTTQCTAIHLALHVLERLVQELLRTHHHQIQQQMATFQPPAAPRTQSSSAGIARTKQLRDEQQLDPFEQLDWIYHRRYIYPIVNCWRDLVFASAISITTTTTKNDAILAPRDMLQKLQKISILAPTSDTHDDNNMFNNRCRRVFPYDIIAIGMIMSVVQLRSPRVEAPLVMERILNFAKQQSQELEEAEPTESGWSATATAAKSIQNGKSRMREKPDVYLYSQVLQVWSQSGLPQASSRITELWNEMKQDRSNNNGSFSYSIAPNEVSYNIVISYWSNQGKAAILESIICDMKQEGFEISPICLAHAIRCFTRQDVDNSLLYAQKAADFTGTLAKVLQQQSPNAKRQTYLPQATEDVMQAFSRNCTRIGNSPSSSRQKQHQYAQLLQSAETFVQVMDRSRCLHTFQYGTKLCLDDFRVPRQVDCLTLTQLFYLSFL